MAGGIYEQSEWPDSGGIASRCAMAATQWSGARSGTTTIRPPATLISPVTAGATTASRATRRFWRLCPACAVVSTPYGPLLTDDYGRSIRFAEYGDGPCRFGDRPIQVMKPYEWLADRVYVFDDEAVASFKDDVTRFVVEACRCFVGGDGDHDRSVVLCREGVAEQLDLSSDAFTPMVGADGNAVRFSYQPCDRLRCVCSTNPAKGLGVFHVWTERGATYQAVLGPCAYECRPEKALTLPDELWSRNESWMRDFFEQETSDFLCLGVVSRRTYFGLVGGNSARG